MHRGKDGQAFFLVRDARSGITARTLRGQPGGYLTWSLITDEVGAVHVRAEYRRLGVATAMLALARRDYPQLRHTTVPGQLSPDGAAWAAAVG